MIAKKLEGEKIYLTPKGIESAELFTRWLNDMEVTDYIGRTSGLITLEMEKEFLQKENADERVFHIVEKSTNKLIGATGIHKIDNINRKATLGIFIGEEEARGKGYGTEIIKLLLDFGFNFLNLNNIDLSVISFNERAIKCYLNAGFKEYGRRRKAIFLDGEYYDVIYMDILKEEFKEKAIKNRRKKI